jgi:hypothetical protein
MNRRHLLYTLYALSCISWLKENKPEDYERLERTCLNLPMPVFFQLMDGIFYYKSQFHIFRALYKWQKNVEEKELKNKVNALAMWSREWSNRFKN